MQGLMVDFWQRPKSKKEVKEIIKTNPERLSLEATSFFGNEYEGPITSMPEDKPAYVVGPDPYTKRNFYLTITRSGNKFKVE